MSTLLIAGTAASGELLQPACGDDLVDLDRAFENIGITGGDTRFSLKQQNTSYVTSMYNIYNTYIAHIAYIIYIYIYIYIIDVGPCGIVCVKASQIM